MIQKKKEEKKKKPPVDNSSSLRDTGHIVKDKIYNWTVRRYGAKGNPWSLSDTVIWYGAIYELPGMVGYVLQFALFWWLAHIYIEKNGGDAAYGVVFLLVVILIRMALLSKQVSTIREDLKKVKGNGVGRV